MPKITRKDAYFERALIEVLTHACEIAKGEIADFCWLTHVIDYAHFPDSLQVIWVFDSARGKASAVEAGHATRMVDMTAAALSELGITLDPIAAHVHFDSEEDCQRSHDGNWQRRLSRFAAKRKS